MGSRTTIYSQAIKLEAVQPFLYLSSYLVGSRTTFRIKLLIGSRITILTQAILLEAVQPLILKLLNWKPYNHFFFSQAIW